jgi:hypothetical protein
MKNKTVSSAGFRVLVLTLILVASFVVSPVLAQEEAMMSDPVVEAGSSVDTTDSPPPPPPQTSASADGLVEVELRCAQSYTGVLYDTPSGHLDAGYFLGTESASIAD